MSTFVNGEKETSIANGTRNGKRGWYKIQGVEIQWKIGGD